MKRYRPTHDEEHALIRRAQSGDDEAMQMLLDAQEGVVRNYVRKIARQYTSHDFEDLVQEGRLAIHTAVLRFDLENGGRLSTYVFCWLRAYMRKAMRRDALIQIPFHVYDNTPYSERDQFPHVAASLDFTIGESQDTTMGDLLASEENIEAEVLAQIEAADRRVMVLELLAGLQPHHRAAIWWMFGLDGHGRRTLSEVAEIMGRSREGVRQHLMQGLRILRLRAARQGDLPLPLEIDSPIAKNRVPRAEIAALAAQGYTHAQIAQELRVNKESIPKALHRYRTETQP